MSGAGASAPGGNDLARGALLMLGSAALFAVMGGLIKVVSARLPNEMVVFFRSAAGLVALIPWIWHRGGWSVLRTEHPRRHLTRALAGLAAMYCYFYAIAHMPLAEATLLNYSTPLFVPFIAWLWLGEPVGRSLKMALAIGFAGIVFILKPGLSLLTPVALVAAAAGAFAAMAMVSIRRLSRSESTTRIVFYFTVISTAISAVPLTWSWRTPPPDLWAPLIVMGVVASAAQLMLTRAYACAPAAQVGPFTYATVVFAALVGWLFWGEIPDAFSVFGALLVALGGVLAIRFAGRYPPRADIEASRA
jgi:drug/metabolite transporter (DMT)-like permease